jgi:PAS domain S-box-containing protein
VVAGSARVTTTDRIALEDAFDGLLEFMADAIVIVDAGGEIVLVNAQTERLFGYRREELLGRRVEMLMAERFRERHVAHRGRHSTDPDPHSRSMGVGLEL